MFPDVINGSELFFGTSLYSLLDKSAEARELIFCLRSCYGCIERLSGRQKSNILAMTEYARDRVGSERNQGHGTHLTSILFFPQGSQVTRASSVARVSLISGRKPGAVRDIQLYYCDKQAGFPSLYESCPFYIWNLTIRSKKAPVPRTTEHVETGIKVHPREI